MKDPNETLAKFGMDPKKILKTRREEVNTVHETLFDGVSRLINHTFDFCEERGFGRTGKIHVAGGAAEAAMFCMAVAMEHHSERKGTGLGEVSFDSVLFAGLYVALSSNVVAGRPAAYESKGIEVAHEMFRQLTGRGFRDCFIDTCGCKNCKARRKEHGIKLRREEDDESWV